MKHDNIINYDEYLSECGRDQLIDTALALGALDDINQMEEMRIGSLRACIRDYVFDCAEQWIDDLPLNDLQLLQMLADNGTSFVEETGQTPVAEFAGLVHYTDAVDDSGMSEVMATDDICQLVTPLLADAIARKQANGEDAMECALCGVLNIVGRMSARKVKQMLERLLPPHDSRVTAAGIDHFMSHSMLVRAYTGYIDDEGDPVLYSQLVDTSWWETDIRDVEPYEPTDIEEIMAHGSFPYFTPTRECEKGFYRLLRDMGGLDHDEALNEITFYYGELQDAKVHLSQLIAEMIEACSPGSKADVERAARTVQNFANGIPKFFLCGQSSSAVAGIPIVGDPSLQGLWHAPMPSAPSGATPPGIDLPLPMVSIPKVGRNDPCPCGSGKKYKNCHGMEN